MRYFLEIAYNGKNYFGWQRQPNEISVQQVLEECLTTFLRQHISIVGAGRTDTGVHAKQMFAHFDCDVIEDLDNFRYRMNSFLPYDIVINEVMAVAASAHARFDAKERTYQYVIVTKKDPFKDKLAYQLFHKPDVVKMNQAAKLLLGRQDFKCFSKSKTDVKTYYCDIKSALWVEEGSKIVFTITADRFLRNMVRAIVGTLLDIRSEEHTSELQSRPHLVCRLLLEKKKKKYIKSIKRKSSAFAPSSIIHSVIHF